jgi:hypothetical protein
MVETDETEVPLRSKHDPIKGYGIPNVGKLLIIGAVELSPDGHPRRVRLEPLRDRTASTSAASLSVWWHLTRLCSATVWRAT